MRYLVCEKQVGEGCDYTIGCGMRYGYVEADSVNDAIEKTVFPEGREESSILEGESARDEILIIPADVTSVVDIDQILRGIKAEKAVLHESEEEAGERALLAKLQAKYPVK